tara:strand:+ start:11508 stop:11657 length:150 start_codon:yes stop_codon:yes gene_type:complete
MAQILKHENQIMIKAILDSFNELPLNAAMCSNVVKKSSSDFAWSNDFDR